MDENDKAYWQGLITWALAEEPPPEYDPQADAAELDRIAAGHG